MKVSLCWGEGERNKTTNNKDKSITNINKNNNNTIKSNT